jgi:anti-sigma factor RsiW
MNTSMTAGPCADFEHDIVELADGSLAPDRARAVRVHVESCARCRAWHSAFAGLDAELEQALPRPALSADFAAKLESRLAAVTRLNGRTGLRTSAEADYRLTLETLRRGSRFSAIVGAMTIVGICAAVLVLVRAVAPDAAPLLTTFAGPERATAFVALGAAVALGALAWSASRGFLPMLRLRA